MVPTNAHKLSPNTRSDEAHALDISALLQSANAQAALVIAHPAHEMRVHHWLTIARPVTYILTSGSRSGDDRTRLDASAQIIIGAGARYVDGWGAIQDKNLYRQILEGDAAHFLSLTQALADDLVAREVSIVVTDSWQQYNVAHDLTHVIARHAATIAALRMGRDLPVVDYPVIPYRLVPNAVKGKTVLDIRLSEQDAAAKDAAVRTIPLISHEVAEIVAAEGADAFSTEQFNLPLPLQDLVPGREGQPYYEEFGEQRVRSGIYMDVIRASHMSRLTRALAACLSS